MQYLCKAGQQSGRRRRTAHLTKTECLFPRAPSLAGQASTGSANAQQDDCQQNQDNSLCCVLLYQQGLGRSDY